MKRLVCLLTAIAAIALCSTSNASITNATWAADRDGVIVCNTWGFDLGQSSLWMYGDQYAVAGNSTGHMLGTIETDSALDPTLTLSGTLGNNTGGNWVGYQINVIMGTSFSFVPPGPTVGNPPTGDWFVASVVAPTFQVSGPWAGFYEGTLFFSGGTPIGIGADMDFLYSINFSDFTSFSFTQEMIPNIVAVPEPSALVLAGMGGLMLALRLRRKLVA
jgi:hypothetical protein